jgi:beta-aspartyl-peptidase (threonine type)
MTRAFRPAARAVVLLAAVAIAMGLSVATPDPATDVRAVLDAQVAAWNHGDLEGYMAGYWRSPELEFYSGTTITRGWQPTLERYRKRYQGAGREMGTLTFTNVRIDVVAPDAAVVSGEWRLEMKSGPPPHGLFTLIVRKFAEGWRIVHDHSS